MRYLTCSFLLSWSFSALFAQISPPGLDEARDAVWAAVGTTQQWRDHWQTTIYLGGSRQSPSGNFSLFNRFAIGVVNLEQGYRFNEHWQLSGCLTYRTQNIYNDDAPPATGIPTREEWRYYARLYYRHQVKRVGFNWSFRPEYRTFFSNSKGWDPVPQQLRIRFKVQASIPLNKSGTNQFIVANEWLTVTDHRIHTGENRHWTPYKFSEDRVTTYFRHTFKKPSLVFDAGLMYQLRPNENAIVHLAFDIIFVDPFGKGNGGSRDTDHHN